MNEQGYQDWREQVPENTPTAYADCTVLIDRSASMVSMQTGVVDGFNEFITSIRKAPGDSRWSLVQFDDRDSARGAGESFPQTLYEGKRESEVPYLTLPALTDRIGSYEHQLAANWGIKPSPEEPTVAIASGAPTVSFVPRGGTALVDAVCLTLQAIQARTSGQDTHVQRMLTIITDGQENASREFNSTRMREMIAEATSKQGLVVQYIGANQDAFAEAGKYGMNQNLGWLNQTVGGAFTASGGIDIGTATNSYNFDPSAAGMKAAITSGFIGNAAVVSGAVARGQLCSSSPAAKALSNTSGG